MPLRSNFPPPRAAPALWVAGLHALLLLGLWQLQAWQARGPAPLAEAPVIVWLQGAPRPTSALPAPAPTVRAAVAAVAQRSPPAITLPSSFVPTPAEVPRPAAPPTTLPTLPLPASAPLNLALPRGASAPWRGLNPALEDSRGQAGSRRTLEDHITAALGGSDEILQTRLADGSVRPQRGTHCVVVRPNRAGELDPFNASAQPRPRLVDRC